MKNEYDNKMRDIFEHMEKNSKDMKINSNFINSSQEIFNSLTIGNAKHDERIKSLEGFSELLDNKLTSLESADLFLQEAHRMLTEKTTYVENESRKLEGTVREQRDELEMTLKKQITMLLKDIEDLNSGIARTDDAIDKLDNQCYDTENKVTLLEEAMNKQSEEGNIKFDTVFDIFKKENLDQLQKIKDSLSCNVSNVETLSKTVENNEVHILNLSKELNSKSELFNEQITKNSQFVEFIKNENNERLDVITNEINVSLPQQLKTLSSNMTEQCNSLKSEVESIHNEVVDRVKEVSVLTTNIDLYVKEQEQKSEEEKMKEITDLDAKIEDFKNIISNRIDIVHSELQVEHQNSSDLNAKVNEEILSQKNRVLINENSIVDILQKITIFEESNQLQAQKIHVIEMLSDRLDHLDEKMGKEELKLINTSQMLQEDYSQKLLGIESRINSLQQDDISNLSEAAKEAKQSIEALRVFYESCMIDKENRVAEQSKLESNSKILDERLEAAKTALSEILVKLATLEEEEMENKAKLISLEEAFHVQDNKTIHVESMVGRMEELRQKSHAESKEEMKNSVNSNAKAIELLQKEFDEKVTNLYNQLSSELGTLHQSQVEMTNSLEKNQEDASNFGNEQENKIVLMMKVIEDHKTLIEKTNTSMTKITERIVLQETNQNNVQNTFLLEAEQKIGKLQDDVSLQLSELISQNSEQQMAIETNAVQIQDWANKLAGVHEQIDKLQDMHEMEKNLIVSRAQGERNSLESFFNNLETRVESIQTTQKKESSHLEEVERACVHSCAQNERLLERLENVERSSQEQQAMIVNVERSTREQAEVLGMELEDYKKTNKEEIGSLRLGAGQPGRGHPGRGGRGGRASPGNKLIKWFGRNKRRALANVRCCQCRNPQTQQSMQNIYLTEAETPETPGDSIQNYRHGDDN